MLLEIEAGCWDEAGVRGEIVLVNGDDCCGEAGVGGLLLVVELNSWDEAGVVDELGKVVDVGS